MKTQYHTTTKRGAFLFLIVSLLLITSLASCGLGAGGTTSTPTSVPSTPTLPSIPPITIGDIQLQVITATKMDTYSPNPGEEYRPSSETDIFLVVEAKILSGDIEKVGDWKVSITDENGRETFCGVTVTYTSLQEVNWPIAVARSSHSFTLNLPGNQTVQLDSLVSTAPAEVIETIESPTLASPVSILQSKAASISIPFCQSARQQGLIKGDTYICVTSEKTSYVGEGQTFILAPSDGPISARVGYEGVLIDFGEWAASNAWEFLFAPAEGQAWVSGIYENNTGDAFPSPQHPGFRVEGNVRECTYDSARFEILELVMDANENVQHFAANFETHCKSYLGNGAIQGVVRYFSTVAP